VWPITARAEEPDQRASQIRSFQVLGVTCQFELDVTRDGDEAQASTHIVTDHRYRQANINEVGIYYVTTGGRDNRVVGSSNASFAHVMTSDARSVTETYHYIEFTHCECATAFTLSPKWRVEITRAMR
jgi:hypothetical protein